MEEVEDRLATKTLQYMEASYNKVLQCFNYDKLQLVQQINKYLEHDLKEKEGTIDYLRNNCSGLDRDRTVVKELYPIINTSFTGGSTPEDSDLNHTLSQVRYVAKRPDDTTLQSQGVLHKTNKHCWGLNNDMEGICSFANENPPNTPTMKSA